MSYLRSNAMQRVAGYDSAYLTYFFCIIHKNWLNFQSSSIRIVPESSSRMIGFSARSPSPSATDIVARRFVGLSSLSSGFSSASRFRFPVVVLLVVEVVPFVFKSISSCGFLGMSGLDGKEMGCVVGSVNGLNNN